jgi:hypothetical protein
MRSVTVIALLSAVLAGGCFSPNYGEGGFKCNTNGSCPEGYTCVQETGNKVCRKSAGPKLDRGQEARPVDHSTGEKLADTRPPDKKVDVVFKDLPGPICKIEQAATNLLKGKQSFSLVLDSSATPHLLYIDASKQIQHVQRKPNGNWGPNPVNIGPAVEVSAAVTQDTVERLHLAYTATDGNVMRSWHAYRPLNGTNWTSIVIDKNLIANNTDISAYKSQVDIVGVGTAIGSNIGWWHAEWGSGVYSYTSIGIVAADKFYDGRIGVGPNGYSAITSFKAATAGWVVRRDHKSGATIQWIAATGSNSSPAPMAVDASGQVHLTYSRSTGMVGPLYYALWTGLTPDTPEAKEVKPLGGTGGNVLFSSMDIALDAASQPVISFFHEDLSVRLVRSGGATTIPWKMLAAAPTGTNGQATRLVVQKSTPPTAHIAFDNNTTLMYASCPLP